MSPSIRRCVIINYDADNDEEKYSLIASAANPPEIHVKCPHIATVNTQKVNIAIFLETYAVLLIQSVALHSNKLVLYFCYIYRIINFDKATQYPIFMISPLHLQCSGWLQNWLLGKSVLLLPFKTVEYP